MVVLHASILGAGTCDPDVVHRLKGKPRPTRRYFALEARRATTELAWLIPPMSNPVVGNTQALTCSADESLAVALSSQAVRELPSSLGELRPKALLQRLENLTASAVPNAPKSGAPKDEESDADDDEESGRSRFLELMSSPLGGNGRLAQLFAALSGASRKTTKAGGGANDDSPTKSVYGRRSVGAGTQAPVRLANASPSKMRNPMVAHATPNGISTDVAIVRTTAQYVNWSRWVRATGLSARRNCATPSDVSTWTCGGAAMRTRAKNSTSMRS